MAQFPSLNQEDIEHFDKVLNDLLAKSEANIAMLVEKAGYLIHQRGAQQAVDITTFATLGSNAYNAVHFMAQLVDEHNFASMYQQGEKFSTLMVNVEENSILVLIFPTHLTVGAIKYFAAPAAKALAERVAVAAQRNPGSGIDLSELDAHDVQAALFQRTE